MTRGVTFTRESAGKIARTVHKVDRLPNSLWSHRRKNKHGGGGAGVSWAQTMWGIKIEDNKAVVNYGLALHAKRGKMEYAGGTKTIDADYQWLWIEYAIGGGVTVPDADVVLPDCDNTNFNVPLGQFRFQNDVVTIRYDGWRGPLVIPGMYA